MMFVEGYLNKVKLVEDLPEVVTSRCPSVSVCPPPDVTKY